MLDNEDMKLQSNKLGYASITPAIRERALAILESVTCDGESLSHIDAPLERSTAAFKIAYSVVATVVLLVGLVAMGFLFFGTSPPIEDF